MASGDGRIAIVGMGCRLPGGAHDPEALWSLLESGKNTMEEIPGSRFNIDDYWSNTGEQNKMMARKGHFLTEGTLFDESFFNLSPREALNTDPQHRILLECVVDALDDAGYRPSNEGGERGWDKTRMGVFVGSATDSYQNNLATNIDAFFCPGTIRGFASGRVSHYFGFQGPSLVYDTACSAGMVAVHSACQSLVLKECDSAIASGTNMLTSPEMFIGLSKGFFISNTGGCRTFDETADGYCRAEGVGVLILKRFEDAIRDNDKIEAVIVASGTNQSGIADSLTMPHAPTQAMLFSSNCERANIPHMAVRAVEAHGTGTQAGDFAEMEAIKAAFCRDRPSVSEKSDSSSTLFVSSLKSNVGHAESASGLTSALKAILMLKHKTILPHIGISTTRNPRLGDLESHGIIIPTLAQPLLPVTGYEDIYISVNNFGAPGGNANIILQDYKPHNATGEPDARTHHIITISAKPHTPFNLVTDRMLTYLEEQGSGIDLASLSYTTTARRVDYPSRVAFSVSSVEELKLRLGKAATPSALKPKSAPRIGFVIAGNGSQYQGMGKALYDTSPTFRANMDHCDGILKGLGESTFLGIVKGEVNPFALDREAFLSASVCIFSVGYSLGMMWKEWGVNPSVIIGHSLGEFAALVLAGCLTVEDAIRILVHRSNILFAPEATAINGGMLVLGVGETIAQDIVKESGCSKVNLSCLNGPAQTTISGPRDELVKLEAFVKALPQPPLVKMLGSNFPWHSPLLDECAEAVRKYSENMTLSPAHTEVLLNVTGSLLQVGETIPTSYLGDQMALPVRFDLCVAEPAAQDVEIWIELSARALLLPLLRPLVNKGVTFLPTLGGPETECWSTITKALGRLYEAYAPINWAAYHRPYQPKLLSLPSYPFARNEHWVKYEDRLHIAPRVQKERTAATPHRHILSTPLGFLEILDPWRRYRLETGTRPIHPGTFSWLALSCTSGKAIVDLNVVDPLAPGNFLTILVETRNSEEWTVSFVKHHGEEGLENGVIIAKCNVESGYFTPNAGTERVFKRSRTKLLKSASSSFFGKAMSLKMLNAALESVGRDEGNYALQGLTVSEDGEEAVSEVRWNEDTDAPGHIDHDRMFFSTVPFTPGQLRSLLQPACLAMFLSTGAVSPNGAYTVRRLDFTEKFHTNPRIGGARALTVHVFLDISNDGPEPRLEGSQSYIYAPGSAALARVTGFKRPPSLASLPKELPSGFSNSPVIAHLPKELPSGLSNSPVSKTSTVIYEASLHSIPSPPTSPSEKGKPLPPVQEEVIVVNKPKNDAKLTPAAITEVLSMELGVPVHSIADEDMLEDLGVDSIMSLLLRDQFSKMAGKKLKWFHWQRGLTVHDLSDYALRALD